MQEVNPGCPGPRALDEEDVDGVGLARKVGGAEGRVVVHVVQFGGGDGRVADFGDGAAEAGVSGERS